MGDLLFFAIWRTQFEINSPKIKLSVSTITLKYVSITEETDRCVGVVSTTAVHSNGKLYIVNYLGTFPIPTLYA